MSDHLRYTVLSIFSELVGKTFKLRMIVLQLLQDFFFPSYQHKIQTFHVHQCTFHVQADNSMYISEMNVFLKTHNMFLHW